MQAPDACREPDREREEREEGAAHQQERDTQQVLERGLLEELDRRRGLLDHDRAHDVVRLEHGLGRGQDRDVAIHRAAPERRAGHADERAVDLLAHRLRFLADAEASAVPPDLLLDPRPAIAGSRCGVTACSWINIH